MGIVDVMDGMPEELYFKVFGMLLSFSAEQRRRHFMQLSVISPARTWPVALKVDLPTGP